MSPASGDVCDSFLRLEAILVSIQLMSPASGDMAGAMLLTYICTRFHSINVPSEWGREHGLIRPEGKFMFPFN